MISFRKINNWYKCAAGKGFKKKLETVHKYPELHTYIIRHRTYKREFFTFTIFTKSKRKRGSL